VEPIDADLLEDQRGRRHRRAIPDERADVSERQVILVVDDDPDFRELLVEHLAASGRRVRSAQHGAEALDILHANRSIGLVLLDLRMPVMDGVEVCRRIEDTPTLHATPVIVLTAEHHTRDVAGFRAVVAVMHKPMEIDQLDELVDSHLPA
jgi:CheY-like chemotaxis protein